MTLANKITLLRILLIPVFVGFMLQYMQTQNQANVSFYYVLALSTFAAASLSDALDGYIARRFNQKSRLGMILDPLADKLLIVSTVCLLSFGTWPTPLPLWFTTIILAKEVFSTAGAFVVDHVAGYVRIEPHGLGKISTFFVLLTLSSALLCWESIVPWASALAAIFAFSSGMVYISEAVRQIKASDHGNGES